MALAILALFFASCNIVSCRAVNLSFEVNDYYWEKAEVITLNGKQTMDVLIVDVTITNESPRRVSLRDWYVTDTEGRRFEFTIFGDIEFEEDLYLEHVEPGGTITGKLAFEVPEDHLPLWVHWGKCPAETKIE